MKPTQALLIALGVLVASRVPASADQTYSSRVFGIGHVRTDKAPDGKIPFVALGFVGTPISGQIKYEIGTIDCPRGGGTCSTVSNAIPNPEYTLFCGGNNPGCNWSWRNSGIIWDGNTGTISGTPTAPGLWFFYAAVRDRVNGERPYRGNGVWGTTFVTSEDGKTWNESIDDETGILVLPQPTGKEIPLQCTFSDSRLPPVSLTLDYDGGYAEVLGNDGNISAVHHIDANANVLGWASGLPDPVGGTAVTIDRQSGTMVVTAYNGQATTAHCEKRSTTRAF
jgi:hypothetical protein